MSGHELFIIGPMIVGDHQPYFTFDETHEVIRLKMYLLFHFGDDSALAASLRDIFIVALGCCGHRRGGGGGGTGCATPGGCCCCG